jgi:hypothetical protein
VVGGRKEKIVFSGMMMMCDAKAATMLGLVIAAFVMPGEAALHPNVLTWTVSDTQEWAATAGFSDVKEAQDAILSHGVTGKILLFVDVSDLQDEFGVESKMEAKMIHDAIAHLQDTPEETPVINGANEGEGSLRLDFYEYRAMNRQQFYKAAGAFQAAPRFAIYSIHNNFATHALPAEPIDTVQWIFLPEFWIWKHSDGILGGLPAGMVFFVTFGFFSKLGAVGKAVKENGAGGILGAIASFFIVEAVLAIFFEIYFHTVWYITPWFFNDAVFWFQMWILPFVMIAKDFGLLPKPGQ